MTTETVCVPRELLKRLIEGGGIDGFITDSEASEGLALLAQPVASEPVAWCFIHQDGSLNDISMTEHSKGMTPLYRHPPAPAIPEGYVLVPIEPTPKMIAALGFGGDEVAAIGHGSIFAELESSYRAMLAAAPQPTEGSTDE